VSVPEPALVRAPLPEIAPEKAELPEEMVVRVPDPREILPAPLIEPRVWLLLARSNAAPLATFRFELLAIAFAAASVMVPALMVVAPL
jgi:hypothetical protein